MPRILRGRWAISSVGTWTFENEIIRIGPKDTNAHTPVFMHLQQYGTGRNDRRSQAAIQRRKQKTLNKRIRKP